MSGTKFGKPRLRRSANSFIGCLFKIRFGQQTELPNMVEQRILFANSTTRSRNHSCTYWLNVYFKLIWTALSAWMGTNLQPPPPNTNIRLGGATLVAEGVQGAQKE
jgi:hypothetical protein